MVESIRLRAKAMVWMSFSAPSFAFQLLIQFRSALALEENYGWILTFSLSGFAKLTNQCISGLTKSMRHTLKKSVESKPRVEGVGSETSRPNIDLVFAT